MIEIKSGRDMADKTCPYCQTRIGLGAAVVVCMDCGMPHHAQCWEYNGGCTTFGCVPGAAEATPCPQVHWEYVAPEGPAPPDRQPTQPDAVGSGSLRPDTSKSCVWAMIALVMFAALLGAAVTMRSGGSPGLERLRQGDTYLRAGDARRAEAEYAEAIRLDPDLAAGYYGRGLALLGIAFDSGSVGSDVLARAVRGDTAQLDEVDRCFRNCLSKMAALDDDQPVEGIGVSKSDVAGDANSYLALTAVLRVLAADVAGQRGCAQQWAAAARQYLGRARAAGRSLRTDEVEDILSRTGY